MAETEYLVFVKGNDSRFLRLSQVKAVTPKSAIEKVVDELVKNGSEGTFDVDHVFDPVKATYSATPVRNWTELPVQAEVVTRIKVG